MKRDFDKYLYTGVSEKSYCSDLSIYNNRLDIYMHLQEIIGTDRNMNMFVAGAGLLKLRDDVQTCEYEDVQVMWEMLQKTETEAIDNNLHHKRKQLPFWRIFVWSNHRETDQASSRVCKSHLKLPPNASKF